jgi:hypothetical protein
MLAKGIVRMRLYSYVVTHDTGFAPNPFFGYCTLACCKPEIRRTAQLGDWVVGLTPKPRGNRIVYYMRLDEIVPSFAAYWRDRRFTAKRPRLDHALRERCGDNAYQPLESGEYRQLPSAHNHWRVGWEDPKTKEHDLSCGRILASETYAYFGSNALPLPHGLESLCIGRGHRCNLPSGIVARFVSFASTKGFGVFGSPTTWSKQDGSWAEEQPGGAEVSHCFTPCSGTAK